MKNKIREVLEIKLSLENIELLSFEVGSLIPLLENVYFVIYRMRMMTTFGNPITCFVTYSHKG